MEANGYGADLAFDGETVVIHAGKMATKVQGTDTITIPVSSIQRVEYKPASRLINGRIRFYLHDMTTETLWSLGANYPNRVNPQSLVVQWRHKDDAAFVKVHEAIMAAVGAPAE